MQRSVRRYTDALLDAADRTDDGAVAELVRRFVAALARRRQRKLLPKIIDAFGAAWDERHGIKRVTVTTALAVDAGLWRQAFGPSARVATTIDPSIIDGAIIDRGDQRIDGSVRTSISRLRTVLARKD